MRKLCFLLLAFCLIILFPTNAWEACEPSVENLNVPGEIVFTSSFCNCIDGDVIIIRITSTNSAVVIDRLVFARAIPHSETNQSRGKQSPADARDCLRIRLKPVTSQ